MFTTESKYMVYRLIDSLRKYRRYDLGVERNRSLLREVYVDPLPDNGVLRFALNDSTCFFTGRKGTGKSTVFLMAQDNIRQTTDKLAVYIDVYTLFGRAQLNPAEVKQYTDHFGAEQVEVAETYLLHKAFIAEFLKETVEEMTRYLKLGLKERLFTDRQDRVDVAITTLETWCKQVLEEDTYRDLALFPLTRTNQKDIQRRSTTKSRGGSAKADLSLSEALPKLGFSAAGETLRVQESTRELFHEFNVVLSRYFDVKEFLGKIAGVLREAGFTKVFMFLDDFSEVDESAQRTIVDVLLSPLNNWSNEFYKMKIAAYPGRIYYGAIDRSKVDEVALDFYDTYVSRKLSDLEQKAINFTTRMITRRADVYMERDFLDYVEDNFKSIFYEELFKATMNNPRRMGHLLLDCYNNQIVHNKRITHTSFIEAAIRLFEKDASVFDDNTKIQQSFGDRLIVYAQQQLLYKLAANARDLVRKLPESGSQFFRNLKVIYASHFYIGVEHESLLRTLEHNFFVTKYHQLKDRDGNEVIVYSLNYGLCQKEQIPFGRPDSTDHGKYFTERAFNNSPLISSFLNSFAEIRCTNDECQEVYSPDRLSTLKFFGMLCPTCLTGRCELSFAYKEVIEELESKYGDIQLPPLEFAIIKVIFEMPDHDWYASAIGEEIDKNYQAVTWAARSLLERSLLIRETKIVGGIERSIYRLTEKALRSYFRESADIAT